MERKIAQWVLPMKDRSHSLEVKENLSDIVVPGFLADVSGMVVSVETVRENI